MKKNKMNTITSKTSEVNKKDRIELLKKVLQKFNEENVEYAILRNYEFLLGEDYPIESLDTVITKEDMPKVDKILKEFSFNKRIQQFSLAHKAYFKLMNLGKVSFDIQVGGVHWNDMQYLGKPIFKKRKLNNYFYTLSDEDYFVMLLVHSILGKRYFKIKYQKILHNLCQKVNQQTVHKKLSNVFSAKKATNLIHSVNKNNFREIKTTPLIFYFFMKKPWRLIKFVPLIKRWITQYKNPFKLAPLISVIGPDGAGKSTTVKSINNYLMSEGRKTRIVYTGRGKNNILPFFSTFGKKYKKFEKKKDRIQIKYGKASPINYKKILYTLTAPIFTFDLYLRYLLKILPLRMNKTIVITDRFCSDIILMKNVPYPFKKILSFVFPKPTINILLYQDPKILHKRRPEESIIELQRQMQIFKRQKYSFVIKTTNFSQDKLKINHFVFKKLLQNWM
jgi:thymidylate kinase